MRSILSYDIKKYSTYTYIRYIIISLIFNLAIFMFVYNFNIDYINKDINKNIRQYNEIDLSSICDISNCEYIRYKNKDYKLNKSTGELYYSNIFPYSLNDILHFKLLIKIPKHNLLVKTRSSVFLIYLLALSILFSIVMFIINKLFTNKLLILIKKSDVISMAGKEAYLINKNMTLLTAHITHEVKTPLATLNNELHEIKNYYDELIQQVRKYPNPNRDIDKIILGCNGKCGECEEFNCKLKRVDKRVISNTKIDEAFSTAEIYIDSIQNILERMQNFKEIKYSNGNKDIYELINVAFRTLSLYHKGFFKYNLDKNLKDKHIGKKMNNADILHIFLNHIKNSLQANATYINISLSSINNSKLILYMTDNGNGIPEDKIPYIFEPKVSTKSSKTNDGIGLYLSKQILLEAGGDEMIQETSYNGTVFKFIIPII